MIRIDDVSTPHTLKKFRTKNGEDYVLKGSNQPAKANDSYVTNYLKLYKKTQIDGLDSFQLVAKKEEKHLRNNGGSFISIAKERFNALTGELTEQSKISQNVFGGKNLECEGNVFSIQGSVSTNTKINKAELVMNTTKGELSPMAKRILKVILK